MVSPKIRKPWVSNNHTDLPTKVINTTNRDPITSALSLNLGEHGLEYPPVFPFGFGSKSKLEKPIYNKKQLLGGKGANLGEMR